MTKNTFMLFNNVVCELYRCQTYEDLGRTFLPVLKLLIPYRYASIMRKDPSPDTQLSLTDPLCVPPEFIEAERNYMRYADDDDTAWLICCRESTLFRESDLLEEQHRLRSSLYQKCYQKFNIFDSLQYGIVHHGTPMGVLSLFRCREDGVFTDDEMFLVSSLGIHLDYKMSTLLGRPVRKASTLGASKDSIATKYGLTVRETQLLELLLNFRDNWEIAEILQIQESTLQKHFQNIFRKFGVTSRWELMRTLQESIL